MCVTSHFGSDNPFGGGDLNWGNSTEMVNPLTITTPLEFEATAVDAKKRCSFTVTSVTVCPKGVK